MKINNNEERNRRGEQITNVRNVTEMSPSRIIIRIKKKIQQGM